MLHSLFSAASSSRLGTSGSTGTVTLRSTEDHEHRFTMHLAVLVGSIARPHFEDRLPDQRRSHEDARRGPPVLRYEQRHHVTRPEDPADRQHPPS